MSLVFTAQNSLLLLLLLCKLMKNLSNCSGVYAIIHFFHLYFSPQTFKFMKLVFKLLVWRPTFGVNLDVILIGENRTVEEKREREINKIEEKMGKGNIITIIIIILKPPLVS